LASGTVQHIDAMNVGAETFTQNEGKLLDSVHRGRVSRRWTGYYIAPAQGKHIVVLQGAGEGSHNRVYVDAGVRLL
jgi:hypothetical protein